MKNLKLALLALIVVVLTAGLAACGSDDETTATTTAAAETEMTDMGEMNEAAAGGIAGPASDLRITLDRLLGEHAMLAMFATQKGLGGEKDFDAIAGALDANAVDLADAIGSVYGDEARTEFLDGKFKWRDHIGFFVDYTVGLAKKDKAAQKKAVDDLGGYIGSFSTFLATATELPNAAVNDSITMHVGQLKGQIDAYSAADYPKAYAQLREAYHHMFMTGDTLAGAISEQQPDDFGAADVTPAASDLRVALGRLLGEHAVLAMVATQKGFSGAKDFETIAAALDANSVDLSKAIGSVYGAPAAKEFLDGDLKWRAHIGFFVDYTVALAKKDKAGQKKAVGNLKGYIESFSGFLATATETDQAPFREALTDHVNQLKGQIDAYAAGDYAMAYEMLREAYAHMYMTGDALAGAIVAQGKVS